MFVMAIAIRRCLSTAVPMNTAISHHSEFTTRLVLDHELAERQRRADRTRRSPRFHARRLVGDDASRMGCAGGASVHFEFGRCSATAC